MNNVNVCPVRTETVALYAMEALPQSEMASFEKHVSTCPTCRHKLTRSAEFRRTIREFASPLIALALRLESRRVRRSPVSGRR